MIPDSGALKQFKISEPAGGYWRATFDNPPHNLLNGETARELQERMLRRHGTVPPEDLLESQTVGFQLVASPQVVQRFLKVREYAAGVGGRDFELNMAINRTGRRQTMTQRPSPKPPQEKNEI